MKRSVEGEHGEICSSCFASSLPLSHCPVCCFYSDPGRGSGFEAVSVAELQHHRVDLPAGGPLAHGPQLRTTYPRIHCPKHRWRTAATAGEP